MLGEITRSAKLNCDLNSDVHEVFGGSKTDKMRQEGSCSEGRHHGS